MFQTIMVPLDGSVAAEQAVPAAARIAGACAATLHLVHVHVPYTVNPITIEDMPVIDDELHSLASEHEQVYLRRVAERVTDDKLHPLTARLTGPVVATLAEYSRAQNADLLVLSTHGHSGFAQLWLGSIAEALVRCLTVPLLLLRPTDPAAPRAPAPFRRILVTLDGSTLAEQILPYVTKLAALDTAEISLLRIVDSHALPDFIPFAEHYRYDDASLEEQRGDAQLYLTRIAEELQAMGHTVHTQVLTANQPARAILSAAESESADLIAMATHGHGGIARTLAGSVADKILRGTTTPVLVCRPNLSE